MRLAREHGELRGMTAQLSRDLIAGERGAVATALNALAQRFRSDVRDMELHVLPALEQLTGVGALSRSAAMRSEHRVLLDLLSSIERAVGRGDLSVAAIDLREFAVTLELHMKKELNIVDLLVGHAGSGSDHVEA